MNDILFKKLVSEKFGSMKKFSDASGISNSSLSEYVNGVKDPTKPNIKLISMMLGVSEKELMEKPKSVEPVASATNIIVMDEVKEEIEKLNVEIRTLRNELGMMAKMLIEINKTTHETSGQAQLNHDELASIFSKVGEINGNVTKLYAQAKKKGY